MCEVTNNFKLCSCSTDNKIETVHNKNSRRHKKYLDEKSSNRIIWNLSEYAGKYEDGMDGMLIAPVDKLDEIFTADNVKTELNKRNCFDFEYSPKEGDYLVLTYYWTRQEMLKQEYKFLPFIYKGGQWTVNSYNSFYDKTREIKSGKVQLE